MSQLCMAAFKKIRQNSPALSVFSLPFESAVFAGMPVKNRVSAFCLKILEKRTPWILHGA